MPSFTPDKYRFETFEDDIAIRGWSWTTNVASGAGLTPFRTGNGFGLGGNSNFLMNDQLISDSRYIVGFVYRSNGIATGDSLAAFRNSSGTFQINIDLTSTGQIRFNRGSGTLLYTSGAGILSAGNLAYVEVDTFIDPTIGWIEVRVDGSVINRFTGNTQGAADVFITQWRVGLFTSSNSVLYDDMYFGWGSLATYLGDVSLTDIYETGDGVYADFIPNSGSPHFSRVNEHPNNGDTSYNRAALSGKKDTYTFPTPTLLPIVGLQLAAIARKDDIGSASLRNIFRTGSTIGVDYLSSGSQSPDQNYRQYTEAMLLNPDTGLPFTAADIANGQFGPATV